MIDSGRQFCGNVRNPNAMTNKTISTESLQQEGRTFPPSPEVVKRALLNAPQFNALYEQSIREPDKFWLEQTNTLEWFKKPTVAGKYTPKPQNPKTPKPHGFKLL